MAESPFSAQAQRDIKRKLRILAEGAERGNVSYTCRRFGISRHTFYRWKREYAAGDPNFFMTSCWICSQARPLGVRRLSF